MLVNSLKWQREYKPWRIVPDDVLGELKNEGKLYHNGFDKYGRPVIYMKPRHDTTGAKERYKKSCNGSSGKRASVSCENSITNITLL